MHSAFRSRLIALGYSEDAKIHSLIKDFCLGNQTEVFDFNHIKATECRLASIDSPRSVNGLFFDKNGQLYFVVTSSYYVLCNTTTSQYIQNLTSGIIEAKAEGTVAVLDVLVQRNHWGTNFESFIKSYSPEKIKTIILTDLTDQEYLTIRLSSLDKLNICSNHPLLGDFMLINCEKFTPTLT